MGIADSKQCKRSCEGCAASIRLSGQNICGIGRFVYCCIICGKRFDYENLFRFDVLSFIGLVQKMTEVNFDSSIYIDQGFDGYIVVQHELGYFQDSKICPKCADKLYSVVSKED